MTATTLNLKQEQASCWLHSVVWVPVDGPLSCPKHVVVQGVAVRDVRGPHLLPPEILRQVRVTLVLLAGEPTATWSVWMPRCTSTWWGMLSSSWWSRWPGGGGPSKRLHQTDFFGKEVWPPSSMDWNTLDNYVLGICVRTINRSSHNTGIPEDGHSERIRGAEMTSVCSRYLSISEYPCQPLSNDCIVRLASALVAGLTARPPTLPAGACPASRAGQSHAAQKLHRAITVYEISNVANHIYW